MSRGKHSAAAAAAKARAESTEIQKLAAELAEARDAIGALRRELRSRPDGKESAALAASVDSLRDELRDAQRERDAAHRDRDATHADLVTVATSYRENQLHFGDEVLAVPGTERILASLGLGDASSRRERRQTKQQTAVLEQVIGGANHLLVTSRRGGYGA